MIKIALAGDTMLGRGVAQRLRTIAPEELFADEVRAFAAEADLFLVNLECCISERGERWPDSHKPFFFRAPPRAIESLRYLGVDAVTLANNHALDYGYEALRDTLDHLREAGIGCCGAGGSEAEARRPVRLSAGGTSVDVIGVTDHPEEYAAARDRPGVAYADLGVATPGWLLETIDASEAEVVLVTPHWGPNMTATPRRYVRRAAAELAEAGAGLIAGHSAHVFQGVEGPTLYDLGDFIDDYAVDPVLRNDLGMLFVVTEDGGYISKIEGLPLTLDYCYTRPAGGDDLRWVVRRFRDACAEFGTEVDEVNGRVIVRMSL